MGQFQISPTSELLSDGKKTWKLPVCFQGFAFLFSSEWLEIIAGCILNVRQRNHFLEKNAISQYLFQTYKDAKNTAATESSRQASY